MSKNDSNEEILTPEDELSAKQVDVQEMKEEQGDQEPGIEPTQPVEGEEETGEDDPIEVDVQVFDESKELAESLVKVEAALKESQDRYARTMAEFDNFRKRTLREKSAMHENGAKEVLEKLLPIVDNFERAIDHISDDEKDLAITQGVEMIYKQLMGTLSEVGVEEIEAKNQEFDPNLHHAVSHEDNDDYDDNMVVEVFQKGYMYNDSVLRHSMVKVVN